MIKSYFNRLLTIRDGDERSGEGLVSEASNDGLECGAVEVRQQVRVQFNRSTGGVIHFDNKRINKIRSNNRLFLFNCFNSPGKDLAAIFVILFDDRSKLVTFAVRVTSFSFTSEMLFFETIKFLSCVNWGRFAGMRVSELLPKLRADSGVVAGMFLMIASIAESSSPLPEQSIVSVVLSPLVGRQVQGRIEAVGHSQLTAEREEKGVAAWSLHDALTT